MQRDPRRDPDRPPEALPRDDRREREPGALARRQPAHARGARRARARGRDRRRDDRDGAARATTCCRRRRSSRSGRRRSSRSSSRENVFQLRAPLFDAAAGHAARARDPPPPGARARRARRRRTSRRCTPRRRRAARRSRRRSSQFTVASDPSSRGLAPVVLYETLGPTLGAGNEAAALALGRRAHLRDELSRVGAARRLRRATGPTLGEALFEAILTRPLGRRSSPSTSTRRPGAALATPDGSDQPRRARAAATSSRRCATRRRRARRATFPFVLAAGERRTVDREHDLPRSRRGGRRTPTARCA